MLGLTSVVQPAQAQSFLCRPQARNFTSPCFVFLFLFGPIVMPHLWKAPQNKTSCPQQPWGQLCLCCFISSAHSQHWELCPQAAPRNQTIRFCPQEKQEGLDFPNTHTTAGACLQAQTPSCIRAGPPASSQQCQDKTPRNAGTEPWRLLGSPHTSLPA